MQHQNVSWICWESLQNWRPISEKKDKGVYKGGTKRIDVEKIKSLKNEGMGATAIARQLGIHRESVYRLLKSER